MLCTFKLGQTFKLQALFQEAEVVSDVNAEYVPLLHVLESTSQYWALLVI